MIPYIAMARQNNIKTIDHNISIVSCGTGCLCTEERECVLQHNVLRKPHPLIKSAVIWSVLGGMYLYTNCTVWYFRRKEC